MRNLENIQNIHMIGIKGIGMTALAEIFKSQGKNISGSDVKDPFFTDQILKRLKIKINKGFSRDNLKHKRKIDLVIYSTSYKPETNEELQTAIDKNFPVMGYPEVLGMLLNSKIGIAVCGTHGKTTTTAMLALLMRDAGMDPTAQIGSKIKQVNSSVLVGESNYMVIEADEYQNKLALYKPKMVILTSIDFDHPDYFENLEAYKQVFKDFIKKIPVNGALVVWGESSATLEVAMEAKCKILIYGNFSKNFEDGSEESGSNERMIHEIKEKFEIAKKNFEFVFIPRNLKLKVIGKHNVLNATGALALAKHLGIEDQIAIDSLNNFQGTSRRLEEIGKRRGALIIDDYAHHPEEVKVTLEALKNKYPRKNLICVFHPHTFTRTKALLSEFSQSFDKADEVIILDVYGSAREKQGGVSAEDLVEKMKMFHQKVCHLKTLDDAYEDLEDRIGGNDVVVTMGAGNVCDLAKKLAS